MTVKYSVFNYLPAQARISLEAIESVSWSKMMRKIPAFLVGAACAWMFSAQVASAATCTVNDPNSAPDAQLTHATACGAGNSTNDSAPLTAILGGGWTFASRTNWNDDGSQQAPMLGTGFSAGAFVLTSDDRRTGTWGIDTAFFPATPTYGEFLIVMKDGSISLDPRPTGGNPNTDYQWYWFLVDKTASGSCAGTVFEYCGTWKMYGDSSNPNTILDTDRKEISHMTLYVREGGGPPFEIPEPAPIALMGLALTGLAFARRRSKAKHTA